MVEKDSKPAYDAQNEVDYKDLTKRLEKALKAIEDDSRLKPTQETLRKLARCSRGTLDNREWPLKRLRQIKQDRRQPKTSPAGAPVETPEMLAERYKQQLDMSREEVLRWKNRHDDKA